MKKMLIAGLTAATLIGSALGLATGTAHAGLADPHHWCPGNPKNMPYVPNDLIDWDWGVCHTWYAVNYGWGNVTMHGLPTSIFDGENPPPEAIAQHVCPPIAFMCP